MTFNTSKIRIGGTGTKQELRDKKTKNTQLNPSLKTVPLVILALTHRFQQHLNS